MRPASGESSAGTRDTSVAYLWFTFKVEAPMEIDAVYGDKMQERQTRQGEEGQGQRQGKAQR